MVTIADRIKELRKSKALTQEAFGKIIGVGKTTISMYETGGSTPDDEIKKKIAEYFNVSVDYLLGNTEIKETADAILKKALDDGQVYFSRSDGYDEDLPDSAKEEIANFIEFVKSKHKKD